MKKIFLFLALIALTLTSINSNVVADTLLVSNSKSAVLYSSEEGVILFEKNKDQKLAPASMTKIMSLIIIYEKMAIANTKKTDMVTVSDHAQSMGGSQVYLEVGEKISVDELLKCICIVSGNDAVVALTEHLYGSELAAVDKMNDKAKELNLSNTHFEDVTGLTDDNHYSSAYDMAVMSNHLITTYPDVLNYTNIREDYIRKETSSPFWLVNTNKLIGRVDGVDGLKTGWTVEAGYCISMTMKKDNMRLISVVMGYESANVRNNESLNLLNYGFANFENRIVYKKGDIIDSIDNVLINPTKYNIIAPLDISILVEKKNNIEITTNLETIEDKTYLNVYKNAELNKTIELITDVEIEKASFFDVILKVLANVF